MKFISTYKLHVTVELQAHIFLRLSPTMSPKFHPLKEYSLSFTAPSKRFRPLYLYPFQQRPLYYILYIK
jgi:hypothetical protein